MAEMNNADYFRTLDDNTLRDMIWTMETEVASIGDKVQGLHREKATIFMKLRVAKLELQKRSLVHADWIPRKPGYYAVDNRESGVLDFYHVVVQDHGPAGALPVLYNMDGSIANWSDFADGTEFKRVTVA